MEYTRGEWRDKLSATGERIIYVENENGIEVICRDVRHWNLSIIKAVPNMYETGLQLLEVMCELCRRLNPQHATCQSCEEIEGYRKAFAKANGKD